MTRGVAIEEVDIAYRDYENRNQPIQAIMAAPRTCRLSTDQLETIRTEMKKAFVHAYGMGVAANAAEFT
jgi:hypothetical protein